MEIYENHKKIYNLMKEIPVDIFYKFPSVHYSCTGYFGPPLSINVPSLCIDGIRITRKYGPLACSQIAVGTTNGEFVFLTDDIATAQATQVQAPEELFDAKNIIVKHHNPFINCITTGDNSVIEISINHTININNIYYYSVSHPSVSSSTEDIVFYVRIDGNWIEVLNRENHSLYQDYFTEQFKKLDTLVENLSINTARTQKFSALYAASFHLISTLINAKHSYVSNPKTIVGLREAFTKYLELLSDEAKSDFCLPLNDTVPHQIAKVGQWITEIKLSNERNHFDDIGSLSIRDICGREILTLGKDDFLKNSDGVYKFPDAIKCASIKITYPASREFYRSLDTKIDVNISNNFVRILDNQYTLDSIQAIGNLINDIMGNARAESCKYFIRSLALQSDPDSHVIAYNYVRNICDTLEEKHLNSFINEQENEINWSKFNDGYIYGRHGFSVPFFNRNREDALSLIEQCLSLLKTMDINCGLMYGTLLGAYRKNKFIVHDDDIDLGYVTSQSELYKTISNIKNIINDNGLVATSYDGISDIICVTNPQHENSIVLEIFPIIRHAENNDDRLYMEKMTIRSIHSDIIGTFSKHVNLEGHSFPAPDKIENFLCERYGLDWMTEKRFFEM